MASFTTNKNDRYFRLEAMRRQGIVQNDSKAAAALCKAAEFRDYQSGKIVISQGGASSEIYFVLSGHVEVRVSGILVDTMEAGDHFGEMALLQTGERRSATVSTSEAATLAVVDAHDFSVIAATNVELWKGIARDLADKLRKRNRFFRKPNERPIIFIGSTTETLTIATAISDALKGWTQKVDVKLWDDIFDLSGTTIESLVQAMNEADFAAFVLSGDDITESRGKKEKAVRDNIIFELGLGIGALGRHRTFMVYDRDAKPKIPSDLFGVTYAPYSGTSKLSDAKRVASAVTKICRSIEKHKMK